MPCTCTCACGTERLRAIAIIGPTGPGGGGSPSPPDRSVQFDNAGALGGSADVAISNDSDQVLVVGLDNVSPIPTTGNFRIVAGPLDGAGFIARFRSGRTNPGDERDVGLWYAYSTSGGDFPGETTVVGIGGWNDGTFPLSYEPERCPTDIVNAFNGGWAAIFTTLDPLTFQSGVAVVQVDTPGPIGGFDHRRFMVIERYTNLILFPSDFAPPDTALGGGEGVIGWGTAIAEPTINPGNNQLVAYASSSAGATDPRPYFRSPAGDKRPMYSASADGRLAANASTSSASYADLITATVSTISGVVDVMATSVSIPNGGNGFFRLAVDGTPIANTSAFIPNQVDPENVAIVARVSGLSVGSHTFSLQWATSTGTLSCNVASQPTIYQANILVRPSS